MTSLPRVALVCAAALVAAAAAFLVLGDPLADDVDPSAGSSTVSPSTSPTPTPSAPARTASTATPSRVGPSPLTVEAAMAVAPVPGGTLVAAEVPVELSSVCEGAALDLADATPAYVSLQTNAAPMRYLDVALAVYDTAESATRGFDRLDAAIGSCPPSRTVTATPAPGATPPAPITIEGRRLDVSITGHPAQPVTQWVQLQTVDSPDTQLRTAITVTVVDNVLLVVSIDQDSKTAGADEIEAASLLQAQQISERLVAAAAAAG